MTARWMLVPLLVGQLAAVGGPAGAFEAPRQVSLATSATEVTYGDKVTFTGQVTAPAGTSSSCVSATTVVIRAMGPTDVVPTPPPSSWGEVGRTATDAAGSFSFAHRPKGNASWVAHLPDEEPAGCDEALSDTVSIDVRVLVELSVRKRRVDRGDRAKLKVKVEPYCSGFGDDVTLQRRRSEEFVEVASGESAEAEPCVVKFKQRIRRSKVYRASSGPNCSIVCTHEEGVSSTLRLIAKKR